MRWPERSWTGRALEICGIGPIFVFVWLGVIYGVCWGDVEVSFDFIFLGKMIGNNGPMDANGLEYRLTLSISTAFFAC